MLQSRYLLLLFAILLAPTPLLAKEFKHKCVHSQLDYADHLRVGPYDEEAAENHTRLLQAGYAPIRIALDFSNLTTTSLANCTAAQSSYIQTTFMPDSEAWFESFLSVIPYPTTLTLSGSSCYQTAIPAFYATTGVQADIVFFVSAVNDPTSSYAAWAAACVFSAYNSRPIAAQVNINTAYLDPTQFAYQKMIARHELIHAFAFSPGLWTHYIYANGTTIPSNLVTQTGVTSRFQATTLIILPSIVAKARAYYNCPSLVGMELENEGGSGSLGAHWEARLLRDEVMTAVASSYMVLTDWTATLMEESGWYKTNMSMTLPARWGYQKGCGFVNNLCVDNSVSPATTAYPEFCTNLNANAGCTYDGSFMGHCWYGTGTAANANWQYFAGQMGVNSFLDNCPYMDEYSGGDCRVPANILPPTPLYPQNATPTSRCFIGTICIATGGYAGNYNPATNRMACWESHCQDNFDGTYTLKVTVGTAVLTCPQAGGTIAAPAGYNGNIVCPNAVQVCVLPPCPSNCSGNGTCIDGACVCNNASLNQWDCSNPNATNTTNTTNTTTNTTGGGSGGSGSGGSGGSGTGGSGTGGSGNGGSGNGGSGNSCNAKTTCNGHGSCTSSNTCKCNDGWSGSACSIESLVMNCARCNDVLDCAGDVCTCTPTPGRNCTALQILFNKASSNLSVGILTLLLIGLLSVFLH
jgi:proprotein convertase subtilisin/kexin type 5